MFVTVTIYCAISVYDSEHTVQEKWARSLEVFIRRGGWGVTVGLVSNRGLGGGGRNKRGGVTGGQRIMMHAISASQGLN